MASIVSHTVISSSAAAIELYAATSGKIVSLMALAIHTEDGAGDVIIEDTAGTNVGGKHLMGQPDSAQSHSGSLILPYNPEGWCRTGAGLGLQLDNEDSATIVGVAVVKIEG